MWIFSATNKLLELNRLRNYLTAKEPEQRVAHIPPMVAPGPARQDVTESEQGSKFTMKPQTVK